MFNAYHRAQNFQSSAHVDAQGASSVARPQRANFAAATRFSSSRAYNDGKVNRKNFREEKQLKASGGVACPPRSGDC
jgi:hypothetical protein